MFTEIQLSAEAFGQIIRSRLQAIPICPDNDVFPNLQGQQVVVERIVVADDTVVQREKRPDASGGVIDAATQTVWVFTFSNYTTFTVPFVQVRQRLDVFLARVADLEANGDAQTAPSEVLGIHVVLNVALQPINPNGVGSGGNVRLFYSLSHIEWGPVLGALPQALRDRIEGRVASLVPPAMDMDLGAISRALGRPVAAVNAGLACDPGGTFVAMRIEFDVQHGQVDVNQAFFVGGPTQRLGDNGWALISDARMLMQEVTRRARDSVTSQPKVKLRWGPNVSWQAGAAAVEVRMGLELVDACPFFVDNINMDVEATIRASFSAVPAQPDLIQTDYSIQGEPSNVGETVACAVTGALLWPFIAPLILREQPLGEGLATYLIGFLLGPIPTFFGILGAINSKTLEDDISDQLGANCQKIDDSHYQCRDPQNLRLPFPGGADIRLQLLQVQGAPEGLVLSGSVLAAPQLVQNVGVESAPFGWTVHGSCRSSDGGRGGYRVVYSADVTVNTTPGVRVCRVEVIDTPEHFEVERAGSTWWIRARLEANGQPNPGAVFPVRLRIVTSAGIRIITLGSFVPMTPQEAAKQDKLRESSERMCQIFKDSITEHMEGLPKGPPGPTDGPDWQPEVQWQVVVRGLEPDRTLEIASPDGRKLVTARPSSSGVIHSSMFLTEEESPEAIVLRLSGEPGSEAIASGTQVVFKPQSVIEVAGDVQSMRFEGSGADRQLIVVDGRLEAVWNVGNAGAPVLLKRTAAPMHHREAFVSDGRQLGLKVSPGMAATIRRLCDGGDTRKAVFPRVGGLKSCALLVRDSGASLFELSAAEPREVQTFEQDPRMSHVALGGDLMARFDPARGAICLFRATQVVELKAPVGQDA